MEILKLDIATANDIMYATIDQYFEDRTFEMYVLDRLFSAESYKDYKARLYKPEKAVDVDKIRKNTNKALEAFQKSYRKEG